METATISQNQKKRNKDPANYLKTYVYPQLNQGLEKLILYLTTSNEIQKYQELLKEQKILDKLEQKRIEKERLKAELGDDYESSGESLDLDDHQDSQKFDEPFEQDLSNIPQSAQEIKDLQKQTTQTQKPNADELATIGEEEKEDGDLDTPLHLNGPRKVKKIFNPLLYLAKTLKNISTQ